jgi:6-pyruvoyltetrahydropterin/6-carboxytetrahydropterin synthase
MFELTVEGVFEAAHRLPDVGGGCEELHSHTYKAAITVSSDSLEAGGVAVDFRILKGILSDSIEPFDHSNLNELPAFEQRPPSAENIAKLVFEQARSRLAKAAPQVKLLKAAIWETGSTSAAYSEP